MNGIRSSPAARIVCQPQLRVLGRRALVGDEVGADRLEHQPLRGGDLAQAREVVARQRRRGSCAAAARARAPARRPTRRRRRSPRSPSSARRSRTPGWWSGASPVRTSSSLTRRRAASSSSALTSSGSCRCGWCVANAQYLQSTRHVRDSDSVTLREKVTRRRTHETLQARLRRLAAAAAMLPRGWPAPAPSSRSPWPPRSPSPAARAPGGPPQRSRRGSSSTSRPTPCTPGSTWRWSATSTGAEGVDLQRRRAVVLDRRAEAPARRARAVRDPRHPRPRARAREGARHRRRDGARAAPAGRRARPAADRAAARPRGQARRGHGPAVRRRRAAARSCRATAATRARCTR